MIASLLFAMASAATDQATPPPPSVVVRAASASEAEALVDKLREEQEAEKSYKAMVPQIVGLMVPQFARDNAGQEGLIRQILVEEISGIGQQLWPEMRQKIRELYVAKFSLAELQEMYRFLGSPVGRKMTRETPDIQLQMMAFGQEAGRAAVAGAMPRILGRMRAANLKLPTGA